MAGTPLGNLQTWGQNYASNIGASYDPVIAAITNRIAGLNTRIAGAPEAVGGLFTGAEQAAGNVGTNISNVGSQFLSAIGGMNLPGMDPNQLALAARSTARGGATGAMLGSVLQTQVGQAKAAATMEAQRRLADELSAAQQEEAATRAEKLRAEADWMPFAQQRQQLQTGVLQNKALRQELKNAPIQRRAAIIANQIARGNLDSTILNNLSAMRQLGLSDADIKKARQLYGGVRAGGRRGSGGSDGNTLQPQRETEEAYG